STKSSSFPPLSATITITTSLPPPPPPPSPPPPPRSNHHHVKDKEKLEIFIVDAVGGCR
ncbi:hypothetical protein C5167_029746, partial [Papaver somniferum]